MMRHRVFIAINLPEAVKKQLVSFRSQWPDLPTRWTKEESLHITLIFLGYLSAEELFKVCGVTKEAAARHQPFSIRLTKICYGPPKKMPPRMVWVEGERSKEFTQLRDDLDKSLSNSGQIRFAPAQRAFSPHITLSRIKTWEWRKIEPEERPEINEDIDLNFEVSSIEVMESALKRGGAEYTILESCKLLR